MLAAAALALSIANPTNGANNAGIVPPSVLDREYEDDTTKEYEMDMVAEYESVKSEWAGDEDYDEEEEPSLPPTLEDTPPPTEDAPTIPVETLAPTAASNDDDDGGTVSTSTITFTAAAAAKATKGPTRSPTRQPTKLPSASPTSSVCKGKVFVPPCKDIAPRDLIFVVDASESIDRDKFYTSTLDFIQAAVCVLNVGQSNQAGLIIFNSAIRAAIPLGSYSPGEWFDQVEAIRNDPTVCCLKGTPMAEAFDLATAQFTAFGKAPAKVAMMITVSFFFLLRLPRAGGELRTTDDLSSF